MYGIPVCNLYLFFFIKKNIMFLSLFFTPHFLKRRDFSSWRRISCGKATKPLPLVKSLKEEAAFSMTTTTMLVARLVQHHHQRPRRYASSFYMGILFWCDDFCAFFSTSGCFPSFSLLWTNATLVRLLSLFLSLERRRRRRRVMER